MSKDGKPNLAKKFFLELWQAALKGLQICLKLFVILFLEPFMTPYVRVKPVLAGSGQEKYEDAFGNSLDVEKSKPEAVVYNNIYFSMDRFKTAKRPMKNLRVSYIVGRSDTKQEINEKDLVIWAKENAEQLKVGSAVIVKSTKAPNFYAMKRITDVKKGNDEFTLASSRKEGKDEVLDKSDYKRSDILGLVVASIPYDEKYAPTEKPVSFSKDIRTIYNWGSPTP